MEKPSSRFTIFDGIFVLVAIAVMVWQLITEEIITQNNCFAVICFFACYIVLCFAGTEIKYCMIDNHTIIMGLNYKTFLLLEKNKNLLCEFQEFCTIKRKKTIIHTLSLIRMFCGEKYDENVCLAKYDNNDKEYFDKLLKNKKLEERQKYKEEIKDCFETKYFPKYFNLFQNYYSGEMLRQKNSVGGILLSVSSIILGIISLVTINAFAALNLFFWGVLISSLLIEIIMDALSWKSALQYHVQRLNETLNELSKDLDEFLTSRQQEEINQKLIQQSI